MKKTTTENSRAEIIHCYPQKFWYIRDPINKTVKVPDKFASRQAAEKYCELQKWSYI
jgi:hypothetical protein